MKQKLYMLTTLLLCSCFASAQERNDSQPVIDLFLAMPNAVVSQPADLTRLMDEKIRGVVHGVVEMSGFRVQVFSSNEHGQAKTDALNVQQMLEQVIDKPVYVISAPPFIKVRVGDFRTQEEALTYKQELIALFPDRVGEIYVVRDEHILVREDKQ